MQKQSVLELTSKDLHSIWEEQLKSRSHFEERIAQLDRDKAELLEQVSPGNAPEPSLYPGEPSPPFCWGLAYADFCYPAVQALHIYLVIWGWSSRKQVKQGGYLCVNSVVVLLGRVLSVVFLSVEHLEQGCSSQFFPWIPSGHLLTLWFLGRVKMLHVSSAVYGGAAACFQGTRRLKALQKNVLKVCWPDELVLGKQEMAACFQGAVFPFPHFLWRKNGSTKSEQLTALLWFGWENTKRKNNMWIGKYPQRRHGNKTLKNSKRSKSSVSPCLLVIEDPMKILD